MVVVALDLSVNSSGICIYDGEIAVARVTPFAYAKLHGGHKFEKALYNGKEIAKSILKLLLPYRLQHDKFKIIIESIGFGYLFGHRTSSTTDLLFEQAVVACELSNWLNCELKFVEPTAHKKAFTGKGNASKELSIARLLDICPDMTCTTDKLDDIADAMSLMSTEVQLQQCKPKFIKLNC